MSRTRYCISYQKSLIHRDTLSAINTYGVSTTGNAAIVSSNIERSCPGELVNITCITVGNSQRWRIFSGSSYQQSSQLLIEKTFRREEVPGTIVKLADPGRNLYTFILISTLYQEFISTVSVVSSSALNNTQLECAATTRSTTWIKTAGICMIN